MWWHPVHDPYVKYLLMHTWSEIIRQRKPWPCEAGTDITYPLVMKPCPLWITFGWMYCNISHLSCILHLLKWIQKPESFQIVVLGVLASCSVMRWVPTFWCNIQGAENSMPKFWEVIRVTKTRIYCQGTICRRGVCAALRPVKVGLIKCWKSSKTTEVFWEKKIHTNLEQMFQRTATDLDTQPTGLSRDWHLQNARLLPEQYRQ